MSKKSILILVIVLAVAVILLTSSSKMKFPVKGKLTSGFGNRIHPISGVKKFHNGIDIAVPIGTSVFSPASGTVSKRFYGSTGGNQLVIVHNNGFQTGYAHLDSFLVKEGEKIAKGQIIAKSGNTGGSTGPHLHLTMYKNGTLVNPKDYLV